MTIGCVNPLFAQADPPEKVQLNSPVDYAVDQPLETEFEWKAADHSTTYDLEISRNADFTWVVVTENGIAGTTHTLNPGQISHMNRYYWRVRGDGAGGKGDWSEPRQFTTDFDSNDFVTVWKTDENGDSSDDQISIAGNVHGAEAYWIKVEKQADGSWKPVGDAEIGNEMVNATVSSPHRITFSEPGTYRVAMENRLDRLIMSSSDDEEKLLDVVQWGTANWDEMSSMFNGASNATVSAEDAPDLALVTTMSYMFGDASSMNGDIGHWDVSGVTNFNAMFYRASSFNQDLNDWDVSSATDMGSMFNGASSFNGNVSDWDVSNVTDMMNMFRGASVFNSDISGWKTPQLNEMAYMFWGAEEFNQDMNGWDVSQVTDFTSVFRVASAFNGDVSDWDVGMGQEFDTMFDTASSFNQDLSAWDMSSAESVTYMFRLAVSFDQDLPNWNVGNVTDFSNMFASASQFNGDISGWDVSSGEVFRSMFSSAVSFNSDISGWDVGSATVMESMFIGAENFNQNLDGWNVGNVTSFARMFSSASEFNGEVGSWDVSSATNMSSMFSNAESFDQDLDSWDVRAVTDFQRMFYGATSFNGDIGSWDTGSAQQMEQMFFNAQSFNQDLNDWDVSGISDFSNMFLGASEFNGDISSWDVSSGTDFSGMFNEAVDFNGEIGGWSMGSATNVSSMFYGASSFNQDLGGWDVSNVQQLSGILQDAGLSPENYDQLLSGWANQSLESGLTLDADGAYYCNSFPDRETMTETHGWTVVDEGMIDRCLPAKVVIQDPVDEGVLMIEEPVFIWNKADRASHYELMVARDDSFSDPAVEEEGITDTTATITSLEEEIEYVWRIRGVRPGGKGPWSELATFLTLPGPPELQFPGDGRVEVSTAPRLQWEQNSTLGEYELQWGFQPELNSPEQNITDTSMVEIPGLEANQGYYWRVRLRVDEYETDWSETRFFQTRVNPEPSTLSNTFDFAPGIEDDPETGTRQYRLDPIHYRLISLPGKAETSLGDLFDEEYGAYWRAFTDDGNIRDYLVERGENDEEFRFQPGKAFWVLSDEPATFDGEITPVETDSLDSYRIPLQEGWNLIANPFGHTVSWSDVLEFNKVSTPLFSYQNSFVLAEEMMPFEGYYFYNDPNNLLDELAIPYSSLEDRGHSGSESFYPIEELDSEVVISASLLTRTDQVAGTHQVGIGYDPDADGASRYEMDHPGLEMVDEGLVILSQKGKSQPIGSADSGRGKLQIADLYSEEGEQYSLQFKSIIGEKVRWSVEVDGLSDWTRVLMVNPVTNQTHLLAANDEVEWEVTESEVVYDIYVGDEQHLTQIQQELDVSSVELLPNYPNPFSERTTIRYAVPEQMPVRLELFDILGRQVHTILDTTAEQGWHTVTFNPRGLASGVYFYRLKAGGKVLNHKMTIIR